MMSKLFAIYAYEDQYGGLHGICDYTVIEAQNLQEASEIGHEMSINIINDYSDIIEDIEADLEDEGLEKDTDEWNKAFDEAINEDVAFNIYEVINETNNSLEHLNEMFYNDPEEFIEKYCKKA